MAMSVDGRVRAVVGDGMGGVGCSGAWECGVGIWVWGVVGGGT